MNKIIPVFLLILSIFGLLAALTAFIFVFLSFTSSIFILPAVLILVISCIVNAFPIVGGIIFKSKLCKAGMVISGICYAFVLIGFILLASM